MERLRAVQWSDAGTQRRLMWASGVCLAVGVLVIVVGVLARWGWTRIIGATLISVGGIGLGALVGLVPTRRDRVRAWLERWRTPIVVVSVLVFALPALLALAVVLVGLLAGRRGVGATAALGGAFVALMLLGATALCLTVALRAVFRIPATTQRTGEEPA